MRLSSKEREKPGFLFVLENVFGRYLRVAKAPIFKVTVKEAGILPFPFFRPFSSRNDPPQPLFKETVLRQGSRNALPVLLRLLTLTKKIAIFPRHFLTSEKEIHCTPRGLPVDIRHGRLPRKVAFRVWVALRVFRRFRDFRPRRWELDSPHPRKKPGGNRHQHFLGSPER